jgi:hypothetical protein
MSRWLASRTGSCMSSSRSTRRKRGETRGHHSFEHCRVWREPLAPLGVVAGPILDLTPSWPSFPCCKASKQQAHAWRL